MAGKVRERYIYLAITILLMIVEIVIAKTLKSGFIRGFVGDVLVVILIYTFLRVFIKKRTRGLGVFIPLGVFSFACIVEFLQYINILKWLGLDSIQFFRTWCGSVFDWGDILAYGIGAAIAMLWEFFMLSLHRRDKIK